ncbi:MAG TPA: alpha/beta hydrolase [Nitrososphaeraceae archaeon]|nr:alpha/beta hydrolase [Nitrososphaeraceae archaeon]
MKIHKLIAIFASLSLVSTILFSLINNIYATTESIPIVSTRSHFDHFGNPIPNKPSYEPFPFDFQTLGCPQEAVIYIHGVWTAKDKVGEDTKGMFESAPEVFERAKLSLENNGYTFPVIGFSWDSDTPISPQGWDYAKIIAKENGPKLAKFIIDLKEKCTQTKIRLIAHSLGARVVLSSLDSLNKNQIWNASNFKITSVDLMGAAVDDDEVSKNAADVVDSSGIKAAYGKAIEEEVLSFYNLFDSDDDALEPGYPLYFDNFNYLEIQPVYYPYFEEDFALGQGGIQSTISDIDKPQNYVDIPVKQEIRNIIDADADGGCDLKYYPNPWYPDYFICTINYVGDNHLGYVGFRSYNNSLIDDGAINIVVDKFQNSP